jgi:AcrR family transcriptional regulator
LAEFYAIEEMINRASDMHEKMASRGQEDCSSCPYLELCTEISEKLKKHRDKTDEVRLLRLVLHRFEFLEPYLNIIESGEGVEENLEEIVRLLGRKSESLEEIFRSKVNELEREIDDLIDAVEDPSIDLAPQDAVEFLAYRLRRLNGIPYKIIFEDRRINNAIDDLFRSIDDEKTEKVRENAKKIFNLTHDPTLGNEGKLLLASLLYCFRHYEIVRDIASQMLSKSELKERKEFALLKCLSYSRLDVEFPSIFNYKKACETCLKAISEFSDDPRFYNMMGVVVANAIENNLEKKKTLDDTIKWFQAALERCSAQDNMLKALLKNNIAYSITQKTEHTSEELNLANQLIEEIEELWPREKWAADFWDTDSCVQSGLAELTDNLTQKKALLSKAIEKERKAKETGEKHRIRESNIRLIQDRLDILDQKLKELNQ